MNLKEKLFSCFILSIPFLLVFVGNYFNFYPSSSQNLIHTKELYPLLNESITDSEDLILISIPWFRYRIRKTEEDYQIMNLIKLLKQKAEQGVKVRVILETDDSNCATLFNLEESGAIIKVHPSLHAKFLVIDNEEAFVMSHNFVPRSFGANEEIGIHLRNKKLAKKLASYFTELWDDSYEEPDFC